EDLMDALVDKDVVNDIFDRRIFHREIIEREIGEHARGDARSLGYGDPCADASLLPCHHPATGAQVHAVVPRNELDRRVSGEAAPAPAGWSTRQGCGGTRRAGADRSLGSARTSQSREYPS